MSTTPPLLLFGTAFCGGTQAVLKYKGRYNEWPTVTAYTVTTSPFMYLRLKDLVEKNPPHYIVRPSHLFASTLIVQCLFYGFGRTIGSLYMKATY